MRFINKAGLLAGGLTTLLILASCSDSDTSTGVTTGKQLANDASTEVVMHQGTAGTGEHSNPDTNHGHSPDQQHAEPNNPTTSKVVALLSIPTPRCGNLIQEDTEQCDGGLGGNATCNTDCTLKTQRGEIIATTACGNGIVDPGEQCDDANDSNEDDCTRFCKTPVCGDGYVQGSNGEQCDDKNRIDTDGCNNACQSSTTTVVTTTTVIEQVNDDGGTTRTPTTPTTNTGGGTTTISDVPSEVLCAWVIPVGQSENADGTMVSDKLIDPSRSDESQAAGAAAGDTETFYCLPDFQLHGSAQVTATCQAGGNWDNAPPVCEAEGVDMETNCTFAPIANSNHASTVTYNIGDKWTYTCIEGFHLDGRENSITFQSNSCVEGSRHDLNPPSSCVENDVSCSEQYATCTERSWNEYIDLFSICEDELRFAHGADFPTFKSIELECLARADRVRVQVYDACATEVDNGGCGG